MDMGNGDGKAIKLWKKEKKRNEKVEVGERTVVIRKVYRCEKERERRNRKGGKR